MPYASAIARAVIFRIGLVVALYVVIGNVDFLSHLPIYQLGFFQFGFNRRLIAFEGLTLTTQSGFKILVRQSVTFLDLLDILVNLLVGDFDAGLADLGFD